MRLSDTLKTQIVVCDLPLRDYVRTLGYALATPADWNNAEIQPRLAANIAQQIAAGVDIFTIPLTSQAARGREALEQELRGAVGLLKAAAPAQLGNVVLPAGDLGLASSGAESFSSALERAQAQVAAVAQLGSDILTITGFASLQILRAYLIAAQALPRELPVWVHWDSPTGSPPPDFPVYLSVAESLNATAVSFTGEYAACRACLTSVRKYTNLPVVVRLNYAESAQLAMQLAELVRLGANGIGLAQTGDTNLIKVVADIAHSARPVQAERIFPLRISSATRLVEIGPHLPLVKIGERINPTGRRKLAAQLAAGRLEQVVADALAQVAAGADALDVNVGAPLVDEPVLMARALLELQARVEIPLVIDSSSVEAIEAGLQVYAGKALVNSVNAKERRLAELLPLVKKYGAAVIALCMGDTVPATAEDRLAFARQIVAACEAYGIDRRHILIDPAALAIATDEASGPAVLKAIYLIKEQLGLPISVGASNTSFGLPERARVHNTFLVQAMAMGLDAAILNPLDPEVHDWIAAASLFTGRDPYCRNYLKKYRQKRQLP